eukprot:m.5593 g.5593  ORF g.5593 m.5593 type:complete len:374 (-) comp3336_c0_seq2:124-1245(-)
MDALEIPKGLEDILKEFTEKAIQEQPQDLTKFGREFFLGKRDHGVETAPMPIDDVMEEDTVPEDYFPPSFNRGKRKSVFERTDLEELRTHEAPQHQKADADKDFLKRTIGEIFMFKHLDTQDVDKLIEAMQIRKTLPGEEVIVQGADGDNIYVIASGLFDVYVQGTHVAEYTGQGHFGELSLLHNCPRAATVISVGHGSLWSLDRYTFRGVVLSKNIATKDSYEERLSQCPLLQDLNPIERQTLADSLERCHFSHEDRIIYQGDPANEMYIILQGKAKVTRHVDNVQREVTVCELTEGDYFGELALLTNNSRAASVWAVGNLTCAKISSAAFERILGPCSEILRRRVGGYEERLCQLFGPNSGRALSLELTAL